MFETLTQYPDGLPCRSSLLPLLLKQHTEIRRTKSENQVGLHIHLCIHYNDFFQSSYTCDRYLYHTLAPLQCRHSNTMTFNLLVDF